MAFQISYVFDFKDKYSKVAADILKKVKSIDKQVLGSDKSFRKFEKTATESLGKISKTASRADRRMESFTHKTEKQTMAMRAMSAVAGNLKFRIASMLVTMAMTGVGMKAFVEKSKPVNTAFKNMSALTGITGKDLEFLERKAFEFSRALGVSMEDAFTGFKRVAGLKPELIGNARALAHLTKWTMILDAPMNQIEKVSRALTVALNVYGKGAESAAEFTNVLAAAQRKGSAEVIDMALSFLKSGAVAETANVSFTELMSAIQALGRAGLLRQMAGTSLRTIMIRVADHAKKSGQSFVGALKDIRKEVFSLEGELERISKAGQIFGKRQATAGLVLIKNIEFMKEFKESIQDTNIALDTAKIALSSYEKETNKIWAAWDRVIKKTFDEASPGLLKLHRSWVAFITQLAMAPPTGLGNLLGLFSEMLADIIDIGNAFLIFWNMVTSPFELAKGWDAFAQRWKDIGTIWDLMTNKTPDIETFAKAGEIKAQADRGAASSEGRVRMDINLRGNTEAVESASVETEGDMDFDTGVNFAF